MKSAGDRMLTMAALRATGLVIGLAALPFVAWPAPESWKWLALTAGVQFGYFVLLVRSYGAGDMSVVYPLARGFAPVLTSVVLISLGILALSFGVGASREAVGLALATGVSVAAYSFFGGLGVRSAGTVLGFQACLEIVTGLGTVGYVAIVRRADLAAYACGAPARGLLAGIISVLGFLAFLVAARSLPLGPVVALRETSVIF